MIKVAVTSFSFVFLLGGCLWVWHPPYSSFWREDIWVHKDDNTVPTAEIVQYCYAQPLAPFKTKNIGGLEIPIDPEEQAKSDDLDGACLYQKGYRFNASYKYCYRFGNICKKWNKYRS